jgi:hypothetical protein
VLAEYSGGQHCRSTKENPATTNFIAYLVTGRLRKISPQFPPDTTLPIMLGKDNTHLLHQPSEIHVHSIGQKSIALPFLKS